MRSLRSFCIRVLCLGWLLLLSYTSAPLASAQTASPTCCLCNPSEGSTTSCLTIDPQKLTGGQRISNPCTRLPSVVGESLKGWTCTKSLSSSECSATKPGLCTQAPQDAFTVSKAGDVVGGAANTSSSVPPTEPPIVPELNVQIPGLKFVASDGVNNPFLAQYVFGAYLYLISISTVAATIMFTWGAFQYLLGSAMPSIAKGKTIMTEAVVGMILVLSAHLILRTVNPDLVTLHSLHVEPITPYSDYEAPLPATSVSIGNYVKPQAICRGDACAAYCNGCAVKYPLPEAPWIPKPSELTTIKASPGLTIAGVGRPQLRKEAAEALAKAGQVAQGMANGPYTIKLGESFRPLDQQMGATCKKLCGNTQKQFAAPGSSLHGTGIAVDVQLWRGGTLLVSPQDPLSNQRQIPEANARILQRIMAEAGWVQYCPEIWHWEFGVPEGGEKSKRCPWPPPEPRK